MSRLSIARAVAAVLVLVAVLPAPAARAEGRYALVVGVEKYNPRFLVPLDHAEDDMERVGAALERLGFNVVTMTSAAEIPERRPVAAKDILNEVDRRLKNREPADTIVLAFSGHGVQLKREANREARETWFCPERARLDDPATLLPLSQVLDRLKACPAKQKLLLVDACRVEVEPKAIRDKSGVPTIELDAAAPFRRQLPEGMAALFSCGPHQKSFELPDTGGVFTHFVVEYLEGRADPSRYRRGEATVQELAAYVSRQTTDHVDQRLREDQEPELVLPAGRLTDWSFGAIGGDLASVDRKPAMERPVPSVPPVPKPSPAAPADPRPGEVIENSLGMKLVVIPAGEFQMGSDESVDHLKAAISASGIEVVPELKIEDQRPAHRVRITRPFLMGAHEVTLGQFLNFYHESYKGRLDCEKDGKGGEGYDPKNAETPYAQKPEYRPWSWGFDGQTNDHPVVNVSWNDCVAFCEWLSRKEGKKYRLPTEAEWEYACRAGSRSRYWNGDDPEKLADIANVGDRTAKDRFKEYWRYHINSRDGFPFTAPVGSYRANPFGLFDMHGNVAEWCSDWYDEDSYSASPAIDPTGPVDGSFRVRRGGGWNYDPCSCQSSSRVAGGTPDGRNDATGFRVVRELE